MLSKLLRYPTVLNKSSISDSHTSKALVSGRIVMSRMQQSTIMVYFALIGCFVGHVDAQLCTYIADWNSFANGTNFTNATVGHGIVMSLRPPNFFNDSEEVGDNHIVELGPKGSIPGNAITFEQFPITGGGQDINFIFSSPVSNLQFTIMDIDNGNQVDFEDGTGYSDQVIVSAPTGFTSTKPTGSTVIGNGTVASPFRNINDVTQAYGDTSPGGNIQISMAGPLTSFTLKYINGLIQNGFAQLIHMSNIKFDAPCPPTLSPTASPSNSPTTAMPTAAPITPSPSKSPTTATPTDSPTARPTHLPTTATPSKSPTTATPTESPTARPTHLPTTATPS